jgi:riboflavin synthase
MFTGLVEEVGTVRGVRRSGSYQILRVAATTVLEGTRLGDSISIDGACQTVTDLTGESFTVETLAASLDKTTLGAYRPGRRVNLERALTPSSRLGGHFVQGHIDGTGEVTEVREEGRNIFFSVDLGEELSRFCVGEGSIAIDGVSLTIAALKGREATVNVIPATWRETALADRSPGDRVNIEVDILGRYVARMLGLSALGSTSTETPRGNGALTAERLQALGY